MAVTLTIDGTDRSRNIAWRALRVDNVITNEQDTAEFEINYDTVALTYRPSAGEVVSIADGGTTIFEGPIVGVDLRSKTVKNAVYTIKAVDYGRFLSRKMVTDTYESMTVAEIAAAIIADYTYSGDGFTVNAQNADIDIDFVQFNYEPVGDCIRQLCEIAALDWYVDENKVVQIFDKNVNSAPFSLTESNGSYVPSSLVLRDDNSQIRNQVYVRGGEYLGAQFTADIECNGQDFIYPLSYRYSDFEATLTGSPLSIGIDYLQEADDYDALFNFQEKVIRFKEADTPSSGALLKVAGKPYLPVIVKVADREAQSNVAATEGGDGIYEDVIIDKSIETKQAARDRATAQIEQYKTTITEGQFTTYTAGLKAGQLINVNLTSLGINKNYIINRVTYRMRSPTTMEYLVSMITTKTFGIIDWMQKQIRDERKKIVINEGEILDVVEIAGATILITETIEVATVREESDQIGLADTFTSYIDDEPTWVAGPYSPTSLSDRKRPMFTDRDCRLS